MDRGTRDTPTSSHGELVFGGREFHKEAGAGLKKEHAHYKIRSKDTPQKEDTTLLVLKVEDEQWGWGVAKWEPRSCQEDESKNRKSPD